MEERRGPPLLDTVEPSVGGALLGRQLSVLDGGIPDRPDVRHACSGGSFGNPKVRLPLSRQNARDQRGTAVYACPVEECADV